MFKFSLAIVLLVAEFLNMERVVEGVQEFKRCYNSSKEETHCFDVQYDNKTNQALFTSFQNAKKRCTDLNSTLVIIENEEIDNMIQVFMKDSNPIGGQYFWLNAYQVNEFDNSYRWYWLNSTLPNLPGSAITYTPDSGWYTAVLEFQTNSAESPFYITARQPIYMFYYVCEYSVSNCSSANSNDVRLMNGRCYRVVQELATWYARNKCLKAGGDLASFANVTSINFTSWLASDSNFKYWIGLRFLWYTWGDQGQKLKYTNWATNDNLLKPCIVYCFNCFPTFTWSTKDCSADNIYYVVCHTITPLEKTTTPSTTVTVSTTQSPNLPTTTGSNTTDTFPSKDGRAPAPIIPLAVGVGVGVGVPVIAGIIVLTICIVRKSRHETASSGQSTNHHQAESSFEQPVDAANVNERDELGDSTTYGVVVPSKSSGQATDAHETNSPAEQTVYAPLQIL